MRTLFLLVILFWVSVFAAFAHADPVRARKCVLDGRLTYQDRACYPVESEVGVVTWADGGNTVIVVSAREKAAAAVAERARIVSTSAGEGVAPTKTRERFSYRPQGAGLDLPDVVPHQSLYSSSSASQ